MKNTPFKYRHVHVMVTTPGISQRITFAHLFFISGGASSSVVFPELSCSLALGSLSWAGWALGAVALCWEPEGCRRMGDREDLCSDTAAHI